MSTLIYLDNVLRESWDDESRTYTSYDEAGEVVSSRPYTEAENAAADAAILAEQARAEQEKLAADTEAVVRAMVATAQPPADGQAWTQPTSAQDAYPLDATVTHGGKTWISLVAFNVHPPGVSGWREIVTEGYPEWVQPSGSHDAYNTGDLVTFEGRTWRSKIDGNVWSPTAHPAGWEEV